jgi:hypothetical protein
MERVTFLIEQTGERISCLLNPENLIWRRQSGLRQRRNATGAITGHGLSDDPVLATGGGVTEMDLDLLFDAAVADELNPARRLSASIAAIGESDEASTPAFIDIRDLTRPFWAMSENSQQKAHFGAPPLVRFIWGRTWNILGLIDAVAERLERFTPTGVPQRSWLRLRLRRVTENNASAAATTRIMSYSGTPTVSEDEPNSILPPILIPIEPDGTPQVRLDQIAADQYGNPAAWKLIAAFNDLEDPLTLPEGKVLRMPPVANARSGS